MCEKKLNVAVIGCGNIAVLHIKGVLAKPECVLYAVCDNASDDRLAKHLEEYKPQRAVADYRELVDDPNVDIAIITTPDKTHMEMTCAFLRAGKDVLLEKPMALTVPECEEMLRAEKESGRRLMVGQVARYNGVFVKAKEIIDSGILGELTFVESEYAHTYKGERGYNDWRVNAEREGMIGGGCHAVDLLRWIAGDPTEVTAYANHKYLMDWPVNDSTIAIYKFPNDVIGKVFCSIGARRRYTMRTCVYGVNGTLIFESNEENITLYLTDENGKNYTKPRYIPASTIDHNMTAEISDFVDAILADKPNPISSIEGASTVAVCRATVESVRVGGPVKISYPKV